MFGKEKRMNHRIMECDAMWWEVTKAMDEGHKSWIMNHSFKRFGFMPCVYMSWCHVMSDQVESDTSHCQSIYQVISHSIKSVGYTISYQWCYAMPCHPNKLCHSNLEWEEMTKSNACLVYSNIYIYIPYPINRMRPKLNAYSRTCPMWCIWDGMG